MGKTKEKTMEKPFVDPISNYFDLYFSNGDHLQVERSSAELH